MLNFFDSILAYIEIVWNFFTNMIESLIAFFAVLIGSYFVPQQLYLVMPAIISASVVSVAAIAVVKLIVGR